VLPTDDWTAELDWCHFFLTSGPRTFIDRWRTNQDRGV